MPVTKFRQDTVKTLSYAGLEGSQCIYWDEALTGFGVRVYPSSRRTYVCSYRVHGRKRLAKLGRVDVLTLDQARKKAKAFLGKAADQEDPQAESDALREVATGKALAEEYIENHAKKKKKTWKSDESCLRRLWTPKFGTRLASTIAPGELQPIHSSVGAEHPYAANRFLEVVRKMINWGKTAGRLPKDHPSPVAGIVWFPERKRRRYVTTVEMPLLIAAIEAEESEYARHAIWLLLLMGLRMQELLRARWEHIDWEAHTLFVGLTKNREPLLAPISDAAIDRLHRIRRLENNPYIICGKKKGQHLVNLRSAWLRIRKAARIEDVTIHDLRRTVGSWLVQQGATLHLVGQVLNHKDPKTTAGYAYFQTKHREEALTVLGEKVLKLATATLGERDQRAAVERKETPIQISAVAGAVSFQRAHYIRREDLYKLVWSAPVSEVAVRFGISDVGLAKVCQRARIPVPGRGYWAKVEAGMLMEPSPLPSPPSGLQDPIRIKGRQRRQKQTAALLSSGTDSHAHQWRA